MGPKKAQRAVAEVWLVNQTGDIMSVRLRRVGANDDRGETMELRVSRHDTILAAPQLYGINDGDRCVHVLGTQSC